MIRLVMLFRGVWPALAGRTLITLEDLDAARDLAHRLATAVQHRDNAPSVPAQSVRDRVRTYTLFRRAYDQCRRALGYLCASASDVEDILPTIFAKGGHYTEPKAATATTPATTPAPAPLRAPATVDERTRNVPQDDPFGRT